MPLDHYLPATYLARFSLQIDKPRRQRRLWAVDKRAGGLFEAPASKLCAAQDFYTVASKDHDPRFVDSQWGAYEATLSTALDQLIDGTLDAHQWLTTLVVFVGALLVRGGDFDERFGRRLEGIGPSLQEYTGRDNTNVVRLMELQRLMAPVIGAQWRVLQTSGRVVQTTNDLGYAAFVAPQRKEAGISIPIGPKHILLVTPTLKRQIVVARDGRWVPCIERGTLDDAQHVLCLQSIAASAQRFVIGPDEATMRGYLATETEPPPVPEPSQLGFFGGAIARHYEMMYFRLLGQLDTPPDASRPGFFVDFEKNMPSSQGAPPG